MNQAVVEEQSQRISTRLEPGKLGFDPATIITILISVLPAIVRCFSRDDEPDPTQVNAAVKRQHAANPDRLRKRTARRIRWEADEPVSRTQALALADAVIAEACESDADTVSALCCACVDEPGELGCP